ncbi:MAG: transketolase [Gammaproteobacteria bacterium]
MTAVSRRRKANAIRALSMDAVQRAGSGHPGAPMGMADLAEVLWGDYLKHNPRNPNWCDRDRFVLSNGHGSMLLYSVLHLCGYDLSLDDLRHFRQLHSNTPGHPEFGDTPGVETTTGPLGQGLANAAGMALAERTLAAQFNRDEHRIVDHFTYVFAGDGCMMEGISHEACSLAGALGLGKLIAFYDDNGISIDGEVAGWFRDDTAARFAAYNWHVIDDVDGHDAGALGRAICAARSDARPSLICCRTIIGFGAPNKAGSAGCHGAPLGEEEIALARKELDWPHPPFVIPPEVAAAWDAREAGAAAEGEWTRRFHAYQQAHPKLAAEFTRRMGAQLPADWKAQAHRVRGEAAGAALSIASRKASQNALENFSPMLPELIGGSADLTGSNLTQWSGSRDIREDPGGNCIYFGVREFAMAAMVNGLTLHRGLKAYGATFLVFSDYARNALRLAALMKIPSLFVFTHDSIGLGGDGPTHQPVEQLASLRLMPRMSVWRPCDAVETAVAWQQALESRAQPFALVFSRQTLMHQPRDAAQLEAIEKGGYVLRDCAGTPEVIFIATGSEVAIAVAAAARMKTRRIRVVSMPSVDRFEAQSAAYRESVLPAAVTARIVIEAGATAGWAKYAGARGVVVGIDAFGASAPGDEVFRHCNITPEHVVECARRIG